MLSFSLKLDGFDKALKKYGEEFEPQLTDAARIAVNETARWALKYTREDMQKNVRFPAGYLNQEDRFKVGKFASNQNLDANIYARFEPTSLARFALDSQTKGGVMVSVKRGGSPKKIKKAFFFGLRKGQVARGNTGLVIRSKESPEGAYKPKEVGPNFPDLWLVYGPSVYQVFRESMDKFIPHVQDELEKRFDRHLQRIMK